LVPGLCHPWSLARPGTVTTMRAPSEVFAVVDTEVCPHQSRHSMHRDSHLRAAPDMAPSKHADQPAANNCSGFVPFPGVSGNDNVISRRPSELRDCPSRPTGRTRLSRIEQLVDAWCQSSEASMCRLPKRRASIDQAPGPIMANVAASTA
jgi:hypothetical protein